MASDEKVSTSFLARRDWLKTLRIFAVEHEISLAAIFNEGIELYAQKHGIKLPKAREAKTSTESDRQTVHVSSAL